MLITRVLLQDGDPGGYDDDDDDCNEPGNPCRLSLVFTGVHHPVVAFPLKPNQIVRSLIRSTGNRQTIGIFADDCSMWAVANNRLQWIIWIYTL